MKGSLALTNITGNSEIGQNIFFVLVREFMILGQKK